MTFTFDQTAFWVTLILIGSVMGAVQGICAYLILAERKISAWAQDRVGPNRVGREFGLPFGLLQPIADGIKFLLKEQIIPGGVDKLFYLIAPCIAVSTALMAIAVVPFGATTPPPVLLDHRTPTQVELSKQVNPKRRYSDMTPQEREGVLSPEQRAQLTDYSKDERVGPAWPRTQGEEFFIHAADEARAKDTKTPTFKDRLAAYEKQVQFVIVPHMDIGVVYVLAVGSLGAYAVVLGGWSSNNKYAMLGSLRSSAQLISYEIPMGMSILGVMVMAGSLNAERIVHHQVLNGWNILFQPLACLLFITSIFAETNRVPFDLSECEQELVGGYHTEYSGMKFAMFFLAEYTHMITTSFLCVALFFGGWHFPYLTSPETGGWADMAIKVGVYSFKMVLFVIFYMYIRWTIPRFRFDQLMGLAWMVMIPLALASLVVVLYVKHFNITPWALLPASLAILVIGALLSLRMPKPAARMKVVWQGHPVTGQSRVMAE